MVNAYFPQDTWYDFSLGARVPTVGQYVNLSTPIQKINVHVRGGFIIPMQIPGANLILGRGNPFELLVALSSSNSASGNLFWDDGDSIGMFSSIFIFSLACNVLFSVIVDSIETKMYNYFEFSVTSGVSISGPGCASSSIFLVFLQNTLTVHTIVANYKVLPMVMDAMKVLGVNETVTNVTVNGKIYTRFLYDPDNNVCI